MTRILDQSNETSITISLDLATVLREKATELYCNNYEINIIDFRDWVNESFAEGSIVNIEVVRRNTLLFEEQDLIIVYATGFTPTLIKDAMTQIGIGLYSKNRWPKAIAVICDDTHFFQVCGFLAHSFYIRPSPILDSTVNRHIRSLVRNANMTRRFGLKLGLITKYIQQRINKSHAKFERKLAKKRGWLWEE